MSNHASVHPVILGGDAGAYSLARAFHEGYGVRSTVVSIRATPNVAHSHIVRNVVEPRLDDPEVMVELIRRAAAASPGPVIALTCVDWYVRALAEHRERLADVAVVPYPSVDLLDRVMDKRRFSELCHRIGVPHPRTEVRDGGGPVGDLDLSYPVIAKPGDNTAWHRVSFPGKAKVHLVRDRAELAALLKAAGEAGYRRPMIIQEYVPGDDSQMRIMTTYSDRAGAVRMAWGGRVLLEEHTPGTLGNPAAILTGRLPQVEADARRLVEHLGWTGFANFDVKVDPRTGVGHFFELNPRTGRSNYYLTASGLNPAAYWMGDHLTGHWPHAPEPVEVLYRIVPGFLLDRYVRDESVRAAVRRARVVHPLKYGRDLSPRRDAWVRLAELNQVRKFSRYHPPQDARGMSGPSRVGAPPSPAEREVA
ncbi:carboxylate--amine ligase [Myceligenerans pegani]|uniref:Carboxylate--amine ligase n=1 Tax=Myceligenerans pegani TaxID=2776917 RepID=A0ABR9N471_9MICO|nr:carboxylate--amine ligase [Myceligenerans sp. TRM 65318]MBE1878458.1 carboxylate--amine ligase [Myceligenerans sp. TRM 65318]MBE3020729.1 carboxylate--amine ligase [Myceligenerans sp. TRM 65318]